MIPIKIGMIGTLTSSTFCVEEQNKFKSKFLVVMTCLHAIKRNKTSSQGNTNLCENQHKVAELVDNNAIDDVSRVQFENFFSRVHQRRPVFGYDDVCNSHEVLEQIFQSLDDIVAATTDAICCKTFGVFQFVLLKI